MSRGIKTQTIATQIIASNKYHLHTFLRRLFVIFFISAAISSCEESPLKALRNCLTERQKIVSKKHTKCKGKVIPSGGVASNVVVHIASFVSKSLRISSKDDILFFGLHREKER